MEPKFDVFGIRPIGGGYGWLMCEAGELAASMRDNEDGGTEWEVKLYPPMTRAEFDALPEFDGW